MPYVNIRIIDEGVSAEQKAELIQETTKLLAAVLNKDPETTFVVIDEVPLENWGAGGLPAEAYRAKKASA